MHIQGETTFGEAAIEQGNDCASELLQQRERKARRRRENDELGFDLNLLTIQCMDKK